MRAQRLIIEHQWSIVKIDKICIIISVKYLQQIGDMFSKKNYWDGGLYQGRQLREITSLMDVSRNLRHMQKENRGSQINHKTTSSYDCSGNVRRLLNSSPNNKPLHLGLADSDISENGYLSNEDHQSSHCTTEQSMQDKYDQLWAENIVLMKKVQTLSQARGNAAESLREMTARFVSQLTKIRDMSPEVEQFLEMYMLGILSIADKMMEGRYSVKNKSNSTKKIRKEEQIKDECQPQENNNYHTTLKLNDLPMLIEEEDSCEGYSQYPCSESASPTLRSHSLPDQQESSIEQEQPSCVMRTSSFVIHRAANLLKMAENSLQKPKINNSENSISQYYLEDQSEPQDKQNQHGKLPSTSTFIPFTKPSQQQIKTSATKHSTSEYVFSQVLSRRKIFLGTDRH